MPAFSVQYQITCYEGEDIREKLEWICLEQSVELPKSVISQDIYDRVVGKVQEVNPVEENSGSFRATIKWPVDNAAADATQFLNILFGNISLKKGIVVESVQWEPLTHIFNGPAFGVGGIREKFGINERPLACGVLKPMGLSADELARQARQFALGGIDIIKDDHGLANQLYAPFKERVTKVVQALRQARAETGIPVRYFPNITVSGSGLMAQYELAAHLGADGVMVLPHLCGYAGMLELAQANIDLPIIAHPAFSGALVTNPEHGFTPAFFYGELYRAFGADFAIYPNTGGRFSFSPQQCMALNEAARTDYSPFKPAFPMPGGGMKRETIPHWMKQYGPDTVFLLGASMLEHSEGLRAAAEEVQEVLKGGRFG